VRAEGMPSRSSGDSTAAQQAHLQMLDAVITGLSQVELGLQAARGSSQEAHRGSPRRSYWRHRGDPRYRIRCPRPASSA
jgi:hypothetical protein